MVACGVIEEGQTRPFESASRVAMWAPPVSAVGGRMRDIGSICGDNNSPSDRHVGLALDVIGRLLERRVNGLAKLKPALVGRLYDLAAEPETDSAGQLIAMFHNECVSDELLAEYYIPEAARQMGEAWTKDDLTFAQVTIGASRLQAMLHDIQSRLRAHSADPTNNSSVLLIVPPGEQHTLGALVAMLEIRRRGVSVSLQIAPTLNDLSKLLALRSFEAVLISLGSAERVEICSKLVKTLKQLSKGRLRVAIGGAAAEDFRATLSESGADLVTQSVKVVLTQFGLCNTEKDRADGGDERASA